MDAKRLLLKRIAVIAVLALILGTVLSFFIAPTVSDRRTRRELGLSEDAFVTDTARDPWVYADEEGRVLLYGDKMIGVEVLHIPSAVNGILVQGLLLASPRPQAVKAVVLPATDDHAKSVAALRWDSIETLAFLEGTADLSNCYVIQMPALTEVYLPRSLQSIKGSFLEKEGITLFYAGTAEEWKALGAGAAALAEKNTVVFDTPLPDWTKK